MAQIEQTLKAIDAWYNELPGGTDRPRLLSRLALLECCGWIEERFDGITQATATKCQVETATSVTEAIGKTAGFEYANHFRKMLVTVGGELLVSKTEASMEANNPGDLDVMKSLLGSLWKVRCSLAHTSSATQLHQQATINAPSWTINQQRVLGKLIVKYETELTASAGHFMRP